MDNPFGAVFRDRVAVRGIAAVVVSALGLGMMPLAIVLMLRSQSRSLAVAGVAAGFFGLGNGIGIPVQGLLIDRVGARRVIAFGGLVCVAGMVVLACLPGSVPSEQYAVLFVCGVTFPAITAAFRAWLPHRLTSETDRTAAYSVLSVAFRAAMACGPVLVGACVAAAWPGAAVMGAAVLVAGGTVTFVTSRDLAQRGGRLVRAADFPWLRRTFPLLFVSAAAGFPIGALAVVVPAAAAAPGQDRIAGFVLACLPAGEACGAIVFGAIRFPGRRRTQLIGTLILVACTYATAAAVATNLWLLACVIFTAGALSSPVAITISGLVDQVASGAVAAAYAGIVSAGIGGSAIGSAVAGSPSHSRGTNSALLTAATACTLAAIVATRIRRQASNLAASGK